MCADVEKFDLVIVENHHHHRRRRRVSLQINLYRQHRYISSYTALDVNTKERGWRGLRCIGFVWLAFCNSHPAH